MESILTTIKKMLGISADYTHFDTDIIVYINTAFMTLNQLGVNILSPGYITNELNTWENLFGDRKDLESIKTYIYLKVRMTFDPPTNSFVMDAMNKQAAELEWRINSQVEYNTDKEG